MLRLIKSLLNSFLAEGLVVTLTLLAGFVFTAAIYDFLCVIRWQPFTSSVALHMFELGTLFAVSIFSTFGYFHSIKTVPDKTGLGLVDQSEVSNTTGTDKSVKNDPSLLAEPDSRRRLVRMFSAANLLSIAFAARAVAHNNLFAQVMAIAAVYFLFCSFGFIVVLCDGAVHERHYHFKWLREENVISLCVFVALALIVVLHRALSHVSPASGGIEADALGYIAFFVGGASMFHVGGSTMKYFYATLLEEEKGNFWMLTAHGCGSVTCPAGAVGGQFVDINIIKRRTKQDFFIVVILFICALLIGIGWAHFSQLLPP